MLDSSKMSDEQLVEAFQAGHIAAYDELVSRWQSKIRGAVWRVLGSTEDAADITQEAFLRAFLFQARGELARPWRADKARKWAGERRKCHGRARARPWSNFACGAMLRPSPSS